MPANYVLLGKVVIGAEAIAEVSFTSIPQTGYSDLLIKVCGRTTTTGSQRNATDIYLRFNGNGANYSSRILSGNDAVDDPPAVPTNAGSSIVWGAETPNADATASVFGNADIYIANYASANHKTTVTQSATENNSANKEIRLAAGLWQDTAAITSISLGSGYYAQHTTFYLYGVAKLGTTPVIVPYATGGDTIMTDGTYWYHTFKSSGTFTPAKAITCDYLVVAGGGGGGSQTTGNAGGYGGGGAGGLRSTVTATGGGGSLESALSLASGTGYTVTIGAGGAAGTGSGRGTNGSNSVFSTITSTGGGGGASQGTDQGLSGGAGGGGGANGSNAGGTGTANQGYAGGQSNTGGYAGSGGGGAGAVGNRSAVIGGNGNAGAGGAGVAVSITGSSVTYAGGGGGGGYREPSPGTTTGGAGGSGGGGAGAVPNDAVAGTANLGGGGGASGCITTGLVIKAPAAGGSGIVVVRYAV
jgi:hypothetical protein